MLLSACALSSLCRCVPFAEDKADDVLLNRSFLRVLEVLSPDSSERAVLDACEKLHEMGKTSPEQVRNLMTSHGVIPIMEMLEVSNSAILHAILKVVNNIVGKSQKFQQSMSLVGLIPAIIRFGGPSYPREIRMEAANFVRQFCYASDWTRKMFIACDGLPVLVSFLSMEEYSMSKTLVWNAIDWSVGGRAAKGERDVQASPCSFAHSIAILLLSALCAVSVTCSTSPRILRMISVVCSASLVCWSH